MATAADRRRWDDLHASYAVAREAARAYESELSRKYGGSHFQNWRLYLGRTERAKLERLEARADKIGDKIVDLIVRISPRGEAWLSGAPAWWIRERLTWEDAVRPASEPLSVVVPAPWGRAEGLKESSPSRARRSPYQEWYDQSEVELIDYVDTVNGLGGLSDANTRKNWLPSDFRWSFRELPVAELLRIMPAQQWRRWYENERAIRADEDVDDTYFDSLEQEWGQLPSPIGPIVIVYDEDGRIDIGDGWHRSAIAVTNGWKTVPSVVGQLVAGRSARSVREVGTQQGSVPDWQSFLVPGDARYVPAIVRPQMPSVIERAIAAGAPEPLEYVGAGMTGVVLCADGVAYKIARDTRPIDHQIFEEEAEWLEAASQVPNVAPYVATFEGFDPDNLVIVRACPQTDPDMSAWRYGEDKLFDLHRRIEREMIPYGWTAPEFKPDSYVLTKQGPILVDASMPSRVGNELAEYVQAVVAGDRPLWTSRPTDLAFAVRREIGQTLSKQEADRLESLIERRWPGSTQQ